MKALIWLAALLCIVNAAAAADAPAPADPALNKQLQAIDARGGAIKDLTAKFTQEKFTALLKKPLLSSGTVRVKGTVIRWDTAKPEQTVLYSDGKEIRIYYPAQKVVEIYPIDQRIGDLVASPLPRLDTLRQHFDIERIALKDMTTQNVTEEQQVALQLTPIDDTLRKHISGVRVLLDIAQAHILKAETTDADDDRTVITFADVKLNNGVKDADVALVVPPGTKEVRPLEGVGEAPKK